MMTASRAFLAVEMVRGQLIVSNQATNERHNIGQRVRLIRGPKRM